MRRTPDVPSVSRLLSSTLTDTPLTAVRRSVRYAGTARGPSQSGPTGRSPAFSDAAARCVTKLRDRLRALSFWLAVGLPWLLLVGLLGGVVTSRPAVLGGLVTVTVLSVYTGREHATES